MAESQQELAPGVAVAPLVRTGAGVPLTVEVTVANTSAAARQLTVLPLGVDPAWLPAPATTPLLAPGASYVVALTLTPAAGTLPAQYPLAISVQALDAAGVASSAPVGIADTVLVVNPRAQLALEIDPPSLTAWRSRRFAVVLRNTGGAPAQVRLKPQTSGSVRLRLAQDEVSIGPGSVLRVRGRATARHPQLIGMRMRHVLRVGATGTEAARYAEGELTQRPLVPPFWLKVIAVLGILSIWIATGITFLPKLADHFGSGSDVASIQADGGAGGSGKGGTGAGGSGGAGSGGSGGKGAGGKGAGGKTSGGQPIQGPGVQLNGTIKAADPGDVHVSIRPTSLVDEDADLGNVKRVGVPVALTAAVGKVSSETIMLRPAVTAHTVSQQRATVTGSDGVWSFPGVTAPGYYLLVFSKPGYQSRSYVVDSSAATAQDPLEVDLQPGEGSLSGLITGPNGKPLGGAAITISDGTSTITASSNTTGKVGSWSVSGLSSPASYVVSASADGTSTEARDVALPAGGSGTADLRLRAGVATLSGVVSATDPSGVVKGFGGATVTVTDGAGLVRTATTVTQDQLAGTYHVPALPVPGDYTVTISGPALQTQTSRLRLSRGQGSATLNASLPSSFGIVQGTVVDDAGAGVSGAGLVLSNADHTYKTTSTGGTTEDEAGSFQITGVTPGTYTLTTQLFSYSGSTLTVDVTTGGVETERPVLQKQAGGVLPATAVILGSAVDASTGKAITGCPPSAPAGTATTHTTTTTSGNDTTTTTTSTDPGRCLTATLTAEAAADQPAGTATYVVPFAPGEQYKLPGTAPDGTALGLRPGLYTVKVGAPGYEYATVDVQVPLGASVTAPVAELLHSPTVQGTITSNADSSPSGPTCIYAIPDTSTSTPTACGAPTPSNCQASPATYDGTADANGMVCAYLNGSGQYRLQLPKHGTYTIRIVPSDPEFVPTSALFTLDSGATQIYDAHLNRYGRIHAVVLKPNGTSTGNLVAAAQGTVVTVTPLIGSTPDSDPTHQRTVLVDSTGKVRLTGLAVGTYRLSAAHDAVDSQYNGSIDVSVSLNIDSDATLSLTHPVGSIIGTVRTTFDTETRDVAGATVKISAPIGYNNNAPIPGSTAPVTSTKGCFGVKYLPAAPAVAVDPSLPRSDCEAWTSSTLTQQTFLSSAADVTISKPGYTTKTLPSYDLAVAPTSNDFLLEPAAVPFAATATVEPASESPWTAATFHVTSTTLSTSGITVSATPTSTAGQAALSWTDTSLASTGVPAPPNTVRPGVYTITADAPGFESNVGKLVCEIGNGSLTVTTCAWASGHQLTLQKRASLTIGALDGTTPIKGATYVLEDALTGAETPLTAGAGAGSVSFDDLAPDPDGGRYTVAIRAAGYRFGTAGDGGDLDLTCAGAEATTIVLAAGDAATCSATLIAGASITGTANGYTSAATATTPTSEALSNATVRAVKCTDATGPSTCDSAHTFTATVASGGSFSITGTDADELKDGIYRLSVAATGWTNTDGKDVAYVTVAGSTVTCDSGSCDTTTGAADLWLRLKPVKVTITLSAGGQKVTDAAVTLLDATKNPIAEYPTLTAPNSDPVSGVNTTYTFTGVMPNAYKIQVLGTSIHDVLDDLPVARVTTSDLAEQDFTVIVVPGASSMSGTVTDDTAGAKPIPLATVWLCKSNATTSGCSTPEKGTDGAPITTTAGTDGRYALQNIPNGSYTVWARAYGFTDTAGQTLGGSTTFSVNYHNAAYVVPIAMPVISQKVTLTLSNPGAPSDDLSAATVTLDGAAGTYNAGVHKIPDATSTSAAAATFNQVPAGCWTITWTLPGDHFGTLTDNVAQSNTDLTCAAGEVLVSGASGTHDASAITSVTEHRIDITIALGTAATSIAGPTTAQIHLFDGTTEKTPAAGVDVATDGVGKQTYWVDTSAAGADRSVSATTTDPWWVPSGTATALGAGGSVALTLTQLRQTVTLAVTNGKGGTVTATDASTPAVTVTATRADAGGTSEDATYTLSLPPGVWTIKATRALYDALTVSPDLDNTATGPVAATLDAITLTPTAPTAPTGSPTP